MTTQLTSTNDPNHDATMATARAQREAGDTQQARDAAGEFPIDYPVVNKVRIADRTIFINGAAVGYIEGTRSEVWLVADHAHNRAFIARFKHFQAGAKSRRFIKAVFSRLTMQQYLDKLATARSPKDVADSIGATYS
jgi:hypothetical protein